MPHSHSASYPFSCTMSRSTFFRRELRLFLLRVLARGDLHTFGITPVLLRGLARGRLHTFGIQRWTAELLPFVRLVAVVSLTFPYRDAGSLQALAVCSASVRGIGRALSSAP